MIVDSPLSMTHDHVGRIAKDPVAMHPRYQRRQQQQATTAAEREAAAHPDAPDLPLPSDAKTSAKVHANNTTPTATMPTQPRISDNADTVSRTTEQPRFPKRPSFDHINLHAPVVAAASSSPSTSRNSSMNLSDLRRRSSATALSFANFSNGSGVNNLSSSGTGLAAKGVNFTSSTKFDFTSASVLTGNLKKPDAPSGNGNSGSVSDNNNNNDNVATIALAKSAGKHIKQLAVAAKAKADTEEDEKESVYTKSGYIPSDPAIPDDCKAYHQTLRRAREASATWDGIALVPELLVGDNVNVGHGVEDVLPSHINPSLSFAIQQLLVRAHRSRLKHQQKKKSAGKGSGSSQSQPDMKLGTDALLLAADLFHHLTYKFADAVRTTVTEGSLSYLQSLGQDRETSLNIRVLNKARDGRYLLVYRPPSSSSIIAFRVLPKDLERIGLAGLVEVYETLPYRQRTENMTRFLNSKRMDLDDPTWFPADFNYDDTISVVGRVLVGELAGEAIRKAQKARIKLNRNRRFVTVLPYVYTWNYVSLLSSKVITESAGVIISAAVEYIIEEILDLSAAVLLEETENNAAKSPNATASEVKKEEVPEKKDGKSGHHSSNVLILRPRHIAMAVCEDEELDALLTAVTMIGDGAIARQPIPSKEMVSKSEASIWVTGEKCCDSKDKHEISTNASSRDLERFARGNIDVLLGTQLRPNLAGAMVDAIVEKEESKLRCPITRRQLYDPVLASDGHTYEREAILNWLEFSDISPVTDKPFRDNRLLPNQHIRQLLKQKTNQSLTLVEVPGELGKMDSCFSTEIILELAAVAGCLQMDEILVQRSKRMLLSYVSGMIRHCDQHARMWNNGVVGINTILACRQKYEDELPPNRKTIPVGTGYLGSLYQSSAVDMNINDPLSFLHLRMSSLMEMGLGAFGGDPNELANALHAAAVEGESVAETDWHERLNKEGRAYAMWRGKVSSAESNKSGQEFDDEKRPDFVRQGSLEGKKLKGEVQSAQTPKDDRAHLSTSYSRASDFLMKTKNRWRGIDSADHIPRFALISFVSLVMKESETMSHPRKAKLKWEIEALLLLCDLTSIHLIDVLKSANFFACSVRGNACISETDVKHSLRLGAL